MEQQWIPQPAGASAKRSAGQGQQPRDLEKERARAQFEFADDATGFLSDTVWPALTLLGGGGVVSGLVSREVAEAGSFPELFLATLAWSLGVTFIVAWLMNNQSSLFGAIVISGIILTASSVFAAYLGVGALNRPLPEPLGNPKDWAGYYLSEAIETYGPFGAMVGGAAGVLAGYWLGRYFKN